MSTTPWGTMNGWLRLETEQRGVWLQQRVQDLRAAQVTRPSENPYERPVLAVAERQADAVLDCRDAETEAEAVAEAA